MLDKVDDSECNVPCVKDKDKKCGGAWRNTIYDIRHLDEDKQQECLKTYEYKLDVENKSCLNDGADFGKDLSLD